MSIRHLLQLLSSASARSQQGVGWHTAYGLLLPLCALWIQLTFWDVFQPLVWILFYPAVILSSYLGGKWACILATLASVLLVKWFFMPPVHSLLLADTAQLAPLTVFISMGLLTAHLYGHLQEKTRQLTQSETWFRTMFEAAPVGVAMSDSLTGEIYSANPRYAAIIGYTQDEMAQMDWMQITHPDDIQPDLDNMARLNAGDISGFAMEKRYIRPDGAIVWVTLNVTPLGRDNAGKPRHLAMVQDITASRALAIHAREDLSLLRLAKDAAMIGVWDWNISNNSLSWDDTLCQWYAVPDAVRSGGIYYDFWRSQVHPDDLPPTEALLAAAIAGENICFDTVFRIALPDQLTRHIHACAVIEKDDRSQPVRMIGINRDITAEIRQREALAEASANAARFASERRLITVLGQELAGVAEATLDGCLTRVNRKYAEIVGYEPAELIGQTVGAISHPDDWERNRQQIKTLCEQGIPFIDERRFRHKDSRYIWAQIAVGMVRDQNGKPSSLVAVIFDVDQRKKAEIALREQERLLAESQRIAHIGSWTLTHDGGGRWSDELYQLFQVSPVAYSPGRDPMADLLHPDDQAAFRSWLTGSWTGERQPPLTVRRELKGGQCRYLNVQSGLLHGRTGQAYLAGTFKDITERYLAEVQLRDNEARHRFALEMLNVGEWELDLTILQATRSAIHAHIFGYQTPDEDWSLEKFLSHVVPGDREWVGQVVCQGIVNKAPWELECRFIRKDDVEERWLHAMGEHKKSTAGHDLVSGIITDITERKQDEIRLRESELHFRAIFENLPVAYHALDIMGHWLDANQHMAELLGFDNPEQMKGLDFVELWEGDWRECCSPGFQSELAKGQVQSEVVLKRRDGERVTALVSGYVERNAEGQSQRCHCIFFDISERRLLEQEIQALHQNLELTVAQRTAEAKSANLAKSRFLANMSHEIRNPLNGVLGMAQLLYQEPMTQDQRAMIAAMIESGRFLLRIINDILDLSKIEAEQLSLERIAINVSNLLEDAMIVFSVLANEKGIAMRLVLPEELPASLIGDPLRLRQILFNLVGNAVKFTSRGEVLVSVHKLSAVDYKARLRFEIKDTGIGIEPASLKQLFTPFSQADGSISRQFGGTGLGLSISKRLVELMRGDIGVESIPSQGSTFWFELDFDEPAGQNGSPPESQATGGETLATGPAISLTGRRVLVVDDNAINRNVVQRLLIREGVIVTLAENGQQALKWLTEKAGQFDAVLMDIQMPVMDGLSATRRLRQIPELRGLPVLALAAGVMVEEQEAAMSAGMNGFIAKPINPQQMIAALRDCWPIECNQA